MENKVIILIIAAVIVIIGIIIFLLLKDNRKKSEEPVEKESGGERKKPAAVSSNSGLMDYDIYVMSKKEKLLWILAAATLLFVVGYIFYRSVILSALLSLLSLLWPKYQTKIIIKRRKNALNVQFKDALYSLSSSLSAGKSVPMSFRDALNDLAIIYENPETFIIKEFQYIIRKMEMNETVEDALDDFARRSHIEDIQNFADVFKTCNRTGGDIKQVMKNSSDIISDKIEIKQEIETMMSQRKLEGKMLVLMPIGLVFLLSISAKEFMQPVFTQILGRIVMTVSIILIAVGALLSIKIMDIEV